MYSTPNLCGWQTAWLALGMSLLVGSAGAEPPLALPAALAEILADDQPDSVDALRLLQEQVRRVVEIARPVTVAVEMGDSVGSGVVISADGLVLTAGHVCGVPNKKVWVRFPDNTRVRGLSLGVNHKIDSGLVRITDPPSKLLEQRQAGAASPPARAADRQVAGEQETDHSPEVDQSAVTDWPFVPIAEVEAEPGDWVVGLGQPNGFVVGRAPPVRLGRVLARRGSALTTDATLVGGDSGGPLLNLRGEVVGIHSKIGERITSNYHVTTEAYRREWDRLVDGRMTGAPDGENAKDWRPLIGIAVAKIDGKLVVTQVFPDSAAQQADLRVGDQPIRLNGVEISSRTEFDRTIRELDPYDRTRLMVLRDGTVVDLEVWLGRAPNQFPGAGTDPEERG